MVDHLANTEINSQRIAAVENCFGASGQPLAVPGRVLLGEGILTKECRKKPKPRIFFLFNDILVYGSIVINKRKYNSQHIIPLEDVTLETLPDTLQMKNRWMIKTSKKSFVVSAASLTERKEWINHLEECIGHLLTKTGRQHSTGHAPLRVCNLCYRQLLAEKKKEAEAEGRQPEPSRSAIPGYEPSSGDDSDKSDDDKADQWPADTEFYTSEVSWSSFHS
ncbi:PREDICTED: pleckstrin homology domain-containing family F member 1-like [Pterocles gutturalis]|uniref:Pleckstrin homology domain-containing family F member 1 n=1 Tax=Pterocles gutturalis TaxID=240206 RepID=A0A093C799_9AVES|nr:PREDICTED: pleckstrin homology domain-containing family F member 1-like [Pterocles gutturalis]KFV10303.1 Pleckstrin homology domain-containing family F member 1 [Pterocles gutturalis]